MEEQSQNIKIISAVIVVLLVLGAGFVLFGKYRDSNGNTNDKSAIVMVENTLMVNGVLPIPAGFPVGIPLEKSGITESATTRYPSENAQQLSVSYQSSKTIAEKYAEYKNYMSQAGYDVAEENANAPTRAIFGTKADANLTVAISSSGGGTLVQLSYLVKSVGE